MKKITDFHTHAFPEHLAPKAIANISHKAKLGDEEVFSDGTLESLLQSMDEAGIYRSVVCLIATTPDQNEAILSWSTCIRSDRIVPFPSIHPKTNNIEDAVRKIADLGFKGIKLHPYYQDFQLEDPAATQIYDAAEKCGLTIVLHSGLDFAFPRDDRRAAPANILNIHRAFPRLRLVAAHMGGWEQWEAVLDTLAGTKVYLETSFSVGFGPDELMMDIIKKHGANRILFGTDSPWRDQKKSLKYLREMLDDTEAINKITRGNAERLLRSR